MKITAPGYSITTKVIRPDELQRSLANDIQFLIEKHDGLKPAEILAIAGQICGMIVARQDIRLTPATISSILQQNIEIGNAVMIAKLRDTPAEGSA
jgi:hypothetical protein